MRQTVWIMRQNWAITFRRLRRCRSSRAQNLTLRLNRFPALLLPRLTVWKLKTEAQCVTKEHLSRCSFGLTLCFLPKHTAKIIQYIKETPGIWEIRRTAICTLRILQAQNMSGMACRGVPLSIIENSMDLLPGFFFFSVSASVLESGFSWTIYKNIFWNAHIIALWSHTLLWWRHSHKIRRSLYSPSCTWSALYDENGFIY